MGGTPVSLRPRNPGRTAQPRKGEDNELLICEGPARTRDAVMGSAACKGGEERNCLR